MTPTDPHAMVRPHSDAQRGLLALGWTVTDTQDGWDQVVTADDLPPEDLGELRRQVELALQDPDYAIVANFDITLTVVKPSHAATYDHLDPLIVTEIDDEWVYAKTEEGSEEASWPPEIFGDHPPSIGDRFHKVVHLDHWDGDADQKTRPAREWLEQQLLPTPPPSEKCEQCQHPWYDGLCECGGWGEDEERRAEEWHQDHPDSRE